MTHTKEVWHTVTSVLNGNRAASGKSIKPYDFKYPEKISRTFMRTLEDMHENTALMIASSMGAYLRTYVDMKAIKCYQVAGDMVIPKPHSEAKLPPYVFVAFDIPPLEGIGLLQVDLQLCFIAIDLLMGGPGWKEQKLRKLTLLEGQLLTNLFRGVINEYVQVWSEVLDVSISPNILSIDTDPNLNPRTLSRQTSHHSLYLQSLYSVNITQNLVDLFINFPLNPILNQLPKLAEKYISRQKKMGLDRDQILRRVSHLKVNLSVELGKATIKTKQLLELKVGDVVLLDKNIKDEFNLTINNQVKLMGRPGLRGERRAIQITKIVKEGEL